jgi:ribosomal protein S27E
MRFLSTVPTQTSALRYNVECPQCGNYYLTFTSPGFKGDQSVCQACADENFAPTRDKMQKIERVYAEAELQRRLAGGTGTKQIIGPFIALSGAPA